jgi:dihydroxyacetone kinase-like protein
MFSVKKILNRPENYVIEMLEGLCAAHPRYFQRSGAEGRVLARPDAPIAGKVGIVTGGGSGHLPVFTGYLGPGLLDACAIGEVFASPGAEPMADAIRVANGGAGVLRLYGNYGGDVMNFDMAGEMVEFEGIRTTTVLVADDVASAGPAERSKRRGVAGMVYCFKIAGAKAAAMASLEEVTAAAQKAADRCRSVGVALTPCTVPAAGRPTFTIGEGEMEIGMGIHGEPGVRRGALRTADEITAEMVEMLLADMPLGAGDRVSVLVNSLGATPLEELYICYRYVARELGAKGVAIVAPLVGRYATSMEMAGMSLTFCKLDIELEALLTAPCDCPFLRI